MRLRRTFVAVLVAAIALASAACTSNSEADQAKSEAKRFFGAWSGGKFDEAAAVTDTPDAAKQWLPEVQTQLEDAKGAFTLGSVTVDGESAIQDFTASWTFPGQTKPWTYSNKLTLVRSGEQWKVHWDPRIIHPELGTGLQFAVTRALPDRAALQDRTGAPIFTKTPVVTVGVEPQKATDINSLATTLAGVLDVKAADIVADVKKAKPDAFVEVITLRRTQYDQVKPQIYDLPGTVFRESERQLAPTSRFGQPFLGSVGEATAEVLKEAGSSYVAGDVLGTSGLQRALNKQLSGTPQVTVAIAGTDGKEVKKLTTLGGTAGTPVKLTIDRDVQNAADAALASVKQYASIVAVKPSTGEILAVANSASVPFNIAMEGQYPPGSTFKIVTAASLLEFGVVPPESQVACPGSLVVGGKKFVNQDEFELGVVPLKTAFARSCNTTFTSLSTKLPKDALVKTAAQFGVGVDWKLPVSTFNGSIPAPKDDTELAADAIGQGRVLTSPLTMALVAATVPAGTVPTPSLIVGQPATVDTKPAALSSTVSGPLRDFTRAVVTEGTGADLAGISGSPAGKTGTAEYGDATPPRSHSWFAGYRGDMAFAVFIYDGFDSGTKAPPVAAKFLSGLS